MFEEEELLIESMKNEKDFNKETGLPIYIPEVGKAGKNKFTIVDGIDKESYILGRNIFNRNNNYKDFGEFKSEIFIHLKRIDSINFYPRDMHEFLRLFLKYNTNNKLYVINGFRSAKQSGLNVHSVGLAMDILADNKNHANTIANAAYSAGAKNIMYGGDFSTGNGYVHFDIAPEKKTLYKEGFYEGPWT